MDGIHLRRCHRRHAIQGIPENVEHASERLRPDRHGNGFTRVIDRDAALESVRRAHGDRPDDSAIQMLLHLERQLFPVDLRLERREERRKIIFGNTQSTTAPTTWETVPGIRRGLGLGSGLGFECAEYPTRLGKRCKAS